MMRAQKAAQPVLSEGEQDLQLRGKEDGEARKGVGEECNGEV